MRGPSARCIEKESLDQGLSMSKVAMALAVLAALVCLGSVACRSDDTGLSRAEVEEIVRDELAEMPAPSAAESGITAEEAERIARGVVASIPPRSAPADYTRFFVEKAISRYQTHGLDATLAHYNRPESIDGQWYVFVIDENDLVIAHPDPGRLGLDLKGWVGTDTNGYNFGPEMLSATGEGKWVSYVYENPESGDLGARHTGELELKNVWVVRHDGLLFASGSYIDADEFTKFLVATAARVFREVGWRGPSPTSPAPRLLLRDWLRSSATTTAPKTFKGTGSRS